MTESTLALMAFLKILWVSVAALLYGLGGTEGFGKYYRRFIMPSWMLVGVIVFSVWGNGFHLWYILYPILLMIFLHLGYGAELGWDKIRRRSLYGLAIGLSALPLCFPSGLFILFGVHVFLCVAGSVALGVMNPAKNARDEESIISVLSTLLPLFLI